jgi:glycosyltransferase involved in cell wall biosynthesis
VVNYGTSAPENLEAAREAFFSAFPNLRGQRFVLFLGRLHEKKGCDLLIEAFGKLSSSSESLQLVVAGPSAHPDYVRHLQQMATASSDRISFPGMLTGEMKWGALSAAEAFVLPSHQENFGIAIAEALACGTPVLISNKVNIWREIEADGTGYVENDDLAGTSNLLKRWLATPPNLRAAMKQSARNSFANRFDIERATDSLLAVIARP